MSASLHFRGFRPYAPQAVVLPRAESSVGWYRGWRDHLEFAVIEAGREADRPEGR